MNLFITLFGGMFLTVLLYGLGRLARMSNFWASAAAAGVPVALYLIIAARELPGLDSVTLHVIAYPTVAILLNQLYSERANHAESMHWAPKLMVGFFMVVSVVFGGMVYIAGNGVPPSVASWLLPSTHGKPIHTGFAGVVGHGENAAKGIAHHLKIEDKLAKLGWAVSVSGMSAILAGESAEVVAHLTGADNQPLNGIEVSLAMARPGQEPEHASPLNGDGAGGYHGTLPGMAAGMWVAYLTLAGQGNTLTLEHTLEVR